jgi:Glycosyl hydrolases family 28/Bacterial Ig-like domain (group 3)/MBG domain (YGX type)
MLRRALFVPLSPVSLALFAIILACLFPLSMASAQAPVALPFTITTLGGLAPMSATAGTQCPNLPAGAVSQDAFGDGCLAVNGIFGAAGRGGVVVDPFGDVFIADDVDDVIHMINPSSGIMTRLAGAGTVCSTKLDGSGDGCIAATQTSINSQRGVGIDQWGNVFLPGYGDHIAHVICRTASPLCTPAQVGTLQAVAGCVTNTGTNGTTGTGLDNTIALTLNAGACSTSLGEINTPRGITADAYGNVYIAETATFRFRAVLGPQTSPYFTGVNPLWTALAVHYPSLTQGFAYTVVDIGGNTAATTAGNACSETVNSVTYSGTALDKFGDGCPLDFSSVNTGSSSYVQGVATDLAGNLVFTDPGNGRLRVFFVSSAGTAGAAMAAAITANNPTVTTPQPGFVYSLAGGGSTSISATPTLGANTSGIDSSIFKVAVSPQGNIFLGDSTKVEFFDITTGYIRTLFSGASSNVTTGNFCSGTSGQTSLSAYSDGCPASKSLFANSNGLGIAADAQGSLYLFDASSNTAGMLVRKVLAQGFAAQTVAIPLTQTFDIHLPESAAASPAGATATLSSTPDVTAGTPACAQNADHSVDCTVAVTATPSAAGLRSAALTLTLPAGSWQNPVANIALGGTVSGSVLAVDDRATTVSGVTTPLAPATNSVFSSIAPLGVALDGAGNIYAMDGNSGAILESVQGAPGVSISSSLPANPGQIAVDAQGNVFAVGSGTPEIEELEVTGAPASAGAPNTFASTSIAYTPANSGTPAPQAIAIDKAGNFFVADNQGSPSSNAVYRISRVAGSPLAQLAIATGFSNPVSLAVDSLGNVYVADKGADAVLKLTPGANGSYTQSTLLSGLTPVAVAVDPAGDVYVQDETSTDVLEVPLSGPANLPVFTGLVAPTGLAVDGKGDVFSADSKSTSITEVVRNAAAYAFPNETTTLTGALTNAGNLAATPANTNTTSFTLGAGATNGCTFSGSTTAGEACNFTASLNYGTGSATDVLSLVPSPASATLGTFTLSGTLEQIATTTSISGPLPANPTTSTGATFTITVTPASGSTAPGGTVTVTVASGGSTVQTYTPALTPSGANGVATVDVTGLSAGSYTIAATYSTSSNATFAGSSSSAVPFTLSLPTAPTTTTLHVNNPSITYGGSITGNVAVAPQSGSGTPTGSVTFYSGTTPLGSCTLSAGACTFTLTNVGAGVQSVTASYSGDSTYSAGISSGVTINVARALLDVTASSYTIPIGAALPSYGYVLTGFVNNDTQASAVTGAPTLTGSAANSNAAGTYAISIATGTLTAPNYNFTFTSGYLRIVPAVEAAAVATGDTRTVAEPAFPAVCQQLNAAITMVNNDIPTSVDATVTNPDGARIQAALAACSGTGEAVELSVDGMGDNAFLSGPLSMPSGVTLLVDPGVVLFFSRNVQDYDTTPGTHTCGTVNNNSATGSCLPLIDVPGSSSNVGIMGFGKLDGRGGDTLLNAFPASFAGQSWWGLSSIANSGGNQQNPRFVQLDTGSSNITLYKITIRNSPLFHVSTTGAVTNFTAWDVKIVTPTTSRNTDGIDPGNAQNFTITRSWISDGDDNVAVGGANSVPAENISVTNNHFFAGHGESIGSFTQAGVSNILYDGNMLWGNESVDSNSTGIRIKSANDRGGLVTNIQYSNSCFQDHKAEIQFTPLYNTDTGTLTPNFQNLLLQNLTFLTEGTVQFTGADNPTNNQINPLTVTLDNVNFNTLQTSDFVTTGDEGTETNAQLTYGPGDVSTNFITGWATFAGSNGDTVANNITASTLFPPECTFTAIAPELTGPAGVPQTITEGDNATAVVILTPAVGGSAYPTGTVTLTDALTGDTTTVTLSGTTDTVFVPLSGLSVGTHTFTAAYSGDSNYVPATGQPYSTAGPYIVTVNAGSLTATTTSLSGVPADISFGSSFTATATVSGSNPTGTVEFVVNGAVYSTAAVTSGTASASISLPFSTTAYSIYAVYSGDIANAGSTSSVSQVTVEAASTTTALAASTTTTTLGHPVTLTATVSSAAGTPTGSVTFTYTTATNSTPVLIATGTLAGGTATAAADLPTGADQVTAAYAANGSFAGSTSTPMAITVNPPAIIPLSTSPIALAYTMTTLAGGASANCSTATDSFGNGCPATQILFTGGSSVDLRAVDADPFGNVYFTDAVASQVRRIAPNGIVTNFAGFVSGTSCLPSATQGCVPNQVKLKTPRGLSTDALGNVYIAGYNDNKAYKYSVSTGLLYLVAGTGTAGTPTAANGDGGPATSANLDASRGIWADSLGDIYIADTSDNKIREVNTTGTIQTIAGTGAAASNGDGGPATQAAIDNPQGVMTDANLNVYIADSSGDKVRVVCVTCGTNSPLDNLLAQLGITAPVNGDIYTIAGGGSSSYTGPFPVLSTSVGLSPQKLGIDLSGNIYISDGDGAAWFLDARTAFIRPIAGKTTANCSAETDNFGDGCPATQAIVGDGGNGIGVGTDSLGNVYVSDTLNARIRKITTNLNTSATATGATTTQPVELHFIPGDTLASTNGLAYSSPEWSLTTPACTTNSDSTSDCLLSSAFTPAVPGARSTPLAVNSSLGNTATLALTGSGLGAGATLDPAAQISFGSGLAVAGLATDNAGNIYVSDSNSKQLFRFAPSAVSQGSSATGTSLATLTAPGAVAVDARGYTYVADTSAGTVTQIAPSGASVTLPFPFTTPAGLAVDALNNLYVSDSSAQAVYQISPFTLAEKTLALGTLVSPMGLAIDPQGNLLVADPGAPAIYRFNLESATRSTVTTPAVAPSVALTDAAGNLLIADTADILAVPASANSSSFTVASLAPAALAVDSAGNLYTGSSGGVLKLARTQGYVQFAVSSAPANVNLLESGNQIYNATSISQTDTSDYSLAPTASTDCALSSGGAGTLAVGGVCALTATYTPTTFLTTTDTATFNGNLSNAALSTPSAVQLTLTGPSTAPASTTTLGAISPASPVYGQTITLSATVTGASVTPAGTVVFTVDSTTYSATLSSGAASVQVNGLTAGSHTLSAAYTSTNGYASSSSSTTTFTVAQATPVVTWPAPSPITYPTALSAAQLDATASVPGTFTYNPASGTVLNAGTQTLSLLFTPADSTDYTSVSKSVPLVVNQAVSTTALAASPNPGAQGKVETLTATVTGAGALTGSVVFTSGSTTLCTTALNASGVATCAFTPSASGTLAIAATYAGDTNHSGSSASLSLNVYDTSITLTFSSTQLTYPGATNITACVAGATKATATGTVKIEDGSTVLTTLTLGGNGCAYWYISPGLSAGAHSITAVYSGDKNNPAGSSAPTIVTVSPVPVTMSVSCWNANFPYGANYQCTVNVSSAAGSAQGSITYSYDGATPVAVALSGGNAGFTITRPVVGNQSVVIAYAQQTNYAAATPQTENFTVTPAPVTVSLTPSTWYAKAGTSVTFSAAVASWSAGAPNDNGSVSFYLGSTLLATVPVNASGQASYTTATLPAGSDTITATYAGGTNYGTGSASVTITLTH